METPTPSDMDSLKRRIRRAEDSLERMLSRLDPGFGAVSPQTGKAAGRALSTALEPNDAALAVVKLHQALSRWVQIEWGVLRFERERSDPVPLAADLLLPLDLDFLEAELRQLRRQHEPANPELLRTSSLPASADPGE